MLKDQIPRFHEALAQVSHATGLVVLDRFTDFFAGVHYKRPLANNGLVERLSAENQHPSVGLGSFS